MKKFPGLTSFLLFPDKLSWLPVTLPILGTLDSNIHGKNFRGDKVIRKAARLFHRKTKAIYGKCCALLTRRSTVLAVDMIHGRGPINKMRPQLKPKKTKVRLY